MADQSQSGIHLPAEPPAPAPSSPLFGTNSVTFLVTLMSLLSIFVFGLACFRRNTLWLWIGFICALISGIFVQLRLNRREAEERSWEAEAQKNPPQVTGSHPSE